MVGLPECLPLSTSFRVLGVSINHGGLVLEQHRSYFAKLVLGYFLCVGLKFEETIFILSFFIEVLLRGKIVVISKI